MIVATLVANYDGNGEFTSVSIEYSANFINEIEAAEKANIMSEASTLVSDEAEIFVDAEWMESLESEEDEEADEEEEESEDEE